MQQVEKPRAESGGAPIRGALTARSVANPPGYHRVRDAIRDDIVNGYFGEESRLVVSALCERYGVTAPPIREALNQLEVEGLVVLSANRGARVRAITPEFVTEVFEIRMMIEPPMVWRNAKLTTASDIKDLDDIQARFEDAIRRNDAADVQKHNRAFHTRIYEIRPNYEAMRIMGFQSAFISTLRNRYGYQVDRLEEIISEHRALIRAMAARDADAARDIEHTHIGHSLADILLLMRSAAA